MNKSDFDDFSKLLVGVAEALEKNLSAERVAIYFNALFSLELAQIRFALSEHVKRSVFFPKPREIIELAALMPRPMVDHKRQDFRQLPERTTSSNLQPKMMRIVHAVACGEMTEEDAFKELGFYINLRGER